MKVVHVISSLDPRAGGPTTALVALARAQVRDAGHDVAVVATWSPAQQPGAADQLRAAGADVRLVGPTVGPLMWHRMIDPTLRDVIAGATIVHVHAIWEQVQHRAAVLARRMNVPYVVTAHGMLDPWSLSQRALKKRLYMAFRLRKNLNRAAAMHYTTDTECDLTRRLELSPPVIIEPYCLDLSEFRDLPPRGWLRRKHPEIGSRKVALFFSRIHPKKGLDLLIPAMARTPADSVLVLAGPVAADFEEEVDRSIDAHGVRDRVIKTGMLYGPDRVAALADADLFVLPSYQENFGIAVVEALAAGAPTIISDQVNIHPTVTRQNVGAVIPTNTEALVEVLNRWLSDDALRQAASQRARAFVFDEYDASRSVRRWTAHYERLLGGHSAQRANPQAAGAA